jgi:hypothetical protein
MPRVLDPFRFVLIAVAGVDEPTPSCRSSITFARRNGFFASNSVGGEFDSTTNNAVD